MRLRETSEITPPNIQQNMSLNVDTFPSERSSKQAKKTTPINLSEKTGILVQLFSTHVPCDGTLVCYERSTGVLQE